MWRLAFIEMLWTKLKIKTLGANHRLGRAKVAHVQLCECQNISIFVCSFICIFHQYTSSSFFVLVTTFIPIFSFVFMVIASCAIWLWNMVSYIKEGIQVKSIWNRPRWSRGNVLVSRSKIRGFKSGWGRWIFSGRKNPEHKSSGRDFKLGVPNPRFQAR